MLLLPVVTGVFVNVVIHLIYPVAANMAVMLGGLPLVSGVLDVRRSHIFKCFIQQSVLPACSSHAAARSLRSSKIACSAAALSLRMESSCAIGKEA